MFDEPVRQPGGHHDVCVVREDDRLVEEPPEEGHERRLGERAVNLNDVRARHQAERREREHRREHPP